jgi:outer membrane biogenesis lipoprotein LolB
VNPAETFELEYNDAGDTFTTSCFQLLQWKHALALEEKGMTLSRGRKVSTHMRKLMGLKRSTPISYLREWVTGALETANAARPVRAADLF